MISRENAREFLEKKVVKGKRETRKKAIDKLSGLPKELGLILLGYHPKFHTDKYYNYYGEPNQTVVNFVYDKTKELLATSEGLWQGENMEVLRIIFGDNATYIREAWEMMSGLMYQTGWSRRSFRAPQNFELTMEKRMDWICRLTKEMVYDLSLVDYTRYAGYLNNLYSNELGYLFAGAIQTNDDTGKAVLQMCLDTVFNEDDVVMMNSHILKALLITEDEKGWDAVEKLLLSAQRQEGLRQTILETLDETSLGAMKHFMKVIIEHKLVRFVSVTRAVDVWCGMNWEGQKERTISRILQIGLDVLQQPESAKDLIKSKDNLEAYIALWAIGCIDIMQAIELVKEMMNSSNKQSQIVALYFLSQTELDEVRTTIAYPFIKSEHPEVVYWALMNIQSFDEKKNPTIFNDFSELWYKLPTKAQTYAGTVFSWLSVELKRGMVERKLLDIAQKTPDRMIPFFKEMELNNRERFARGLNDLKFEITPAFRTLIFDMLADKGEYVRRSAFTLVEKINVTSEECLELETLLKRQSADLRKGIIKIILALKDDALLESVSRLLQAKNVQQRLGGLDLLLILKKDKRCLTQVPVLAATFAERPRISEKERVILDAVKDESEQYTPENGFGLYNPNDLSSSPDPVAQHTEKSGLLGKLKNAFSSNKTSTFLSKSLKELEADFKKLDDLIHQNKDYEYEVEYWDGSKDSILLSHNFRSISKRVDHKDAKAIRENYPLMEVWEQWLAEAKLTKMDLMFCDRISTYFYESDEDSTKKAPAWYDDIVKQYYPMEEMVIDSEKTKYKYPRHVKNILGILEHLNPVEEQGKLALKFAESIYAYIPKDELNKSYKYFYPYYRYDEDKRIYTWRSSNVIDGWLNMANAQLEHLSDEEQNKVWHLYNWISQTATEKEEKSTPGLPLYAAVYDNGGITENDLFHKILTDNDTIRTLTNTVRRNDQPLLVDKYEFLKKMTKLVVDRVLEIELKRGDSETAVSKKAMRIQRVNGIDYLPKILKALGKDKLARSTYYYWRNNVSKKLVMSHLLKVLHPAEGETQEDFNQMMKAAKIPEKRIIDVAMYAPQWIPYIQSYLNWNGLQSAIWWFHGHTKESGWNIENKFESDISKYTPLEAKDLTDGAVDVVWFKEAYKAIGKKRWDMLYQSAKYISEGPGHKRAQLFADVMLKKAGIREVTKFITEKRRQDYVRALGLVPLSRTKPDQDVLKRYQLLQLFKKESKQFGSQRQASEGLAVRIGMENLARTAGYPDPIRLSWAMETREAQEILAKAKPIEEGNVKIELLVDELGKAHLMVHKGEKTIKSIPAKFKKDKRVAQLKEYKKILSNQYRRTRKSLEEAMNRGDAFTLKEIQTLMTHPVVAPLLGNLVMVNATDESAIGYFENNQLVQPSGESFEVNEDTPIRIAHCVDLYASKQWTMFQKDVFSKKRIQPFKQIFRELYLPTEDELALKTLSRRYAGHQVQPKQTLALLKTRGWTVDYESGLQKVIHNKGYIVQLYAYADWFSPADTEAPTIEQVEFIDRKTHKAVELDKIDKLLFSEVMRDLDLVVSVAHVGGVDPEASHSTVEMRTVLLNETMELIGINNTHVKGRHAHIKGELGEYTVHLGSGTVHRQPGGYVAIIPVHAQRRGRVFLPFVDDDPKTAEIISKILLLSEDQKIQDPTILKQLV